MPIHTKSDDDAHVFSAYLSAISALWNILSYVSTDYVLGMFNVIFTKAWWS